MKTRLLVVIAILCTALILLSLATLCRGTLALSVQQLLAIFTGQGSAGSRLVVLDWRLPRLLVGLLCGSALGVSGAIFQSLLRNPLGSPDVLGLNAGAFSGVLIVMLLWPGNLTAITCASLVAAMLTGLLIYLLAWRNGVATFRLILIGIGIRALLMSFNSWVITSSSLTTAMTAGLWSAGSLNGIGWASLPVLSIFLLLAVLGVSMLARTMRLLEMGDETACALGVNTEGSRRGLLILGVLLTAVPTAIIGPVSFIALVAPQIAARINSNQQGALWCSALCGSLLLIAADYFAQHGFPPYQLPVGVITVSIGGVYLLSLLVREARRS